MPITYKQDILAALKEAGYNTNRLRKEANYLQAGYSGSIEGSRVQY